MCIRDRIQKYTTVTVKTKIIIIIIIIMNICFSFSYSIFHCLVVHSTDLRRVRMFIFTIQLGKCFGLIIFNVTCHLSLVTGNKNNTFCMNEHKMNT